MGICWEYEQIPKNDGNMNYLSSDIPHFAFKSPNKPPPMFQYAGQNKTCIYSWLWYTMFVAGHWVWFTILLLGYTMTTSICSPELHNLRSILGFLYKSEGKTPEYYRVKADRDALSLKEGNPGRYIAPKSAGVTSTKKVINTAMLQGKELKACEFVTGGVWIEGHYYKAV